MGTDIPRGTHETVATAMRLIHQTLVEEEELVDESDIDVWVNQNGGIHVDFDIEFDEFPVRQDIASAEEARTHLHNASSALIGVGNDDLYESFETWRREHSEELDI